MNMEARGLNSACWSFSGIFAVGVYSYAVVSNHVHVVVRGCCPIALLNTTEPCAIFGS